MKTGSIHAIFFIVLLVFLAGKCEEQEGNPATGKLTNLEGLSGCGWVIELDDGTRLEPLNLADFEASPEEGKRIRFLYRERDEVATNCMVGPVITLLDYSEQKE